MNLFTNEEEKLCSQISKNSTVAIFGNNEVAEKIYEIIAKLRPDIKILFFIDSKLSGEIKNLPLYPAKDIDKHIDKVDAVIVASYSNRLYMEFILKSFNAKKIIFSSKKFVDKYSNKTIEHNYDVNKSAKVFKTFSDRTLYKALAFARKHKKKFFPIIKKYYNFKYPDKIGGYAKEHYFEFINKDVIQVALDVGACDAVHSLFMLDNFKNCKKVYTFEPCYESFKNDLYDKLIKRRSEIEIIDKAIWKENTELEFREDSMKGGSAIIEVKPNIRRPSKTIKVQTITIDDFVEQNNIQRLDYIKMDIENAEQEALLGAEKSLLRFRPQLAISIYHFDPQFFEIPLYLKNLLPNYEFRLAHYRPDLFDTVLYAIPKEII